MGFWGQTATAPTKGLTLPSPREDAPSHTAWVLLAQRAGTLWVPFQILRGGLPTTTGNLKLLKGYTAEDFTLSRCGLG